MMVTPTPRDSYPRLFERVQLERLFPDSKTFVDAVPRSQPAVINAAFDRASGLEDFDLQDFVVEHFELPQSPDISRCAVRSAAVTTAIEMLWDTLTRAPDEKVAHSSLIPLPNAYVVPGGRFREIYYWDSYFTMLGLAESGHLERIRGMVDNFAYLIDTVGFIPNGNRNYFCTRTQPPFFALMVELFERVSGVAGVAARYQPQLLREYDFWMSGADRLARNLPAHRRVVAIDNAVLNRYWDDAAEPRQESYAEDVALASTTSRPREDLFRDLRAACESGWDFSSRWLGESNSLGGIRTTQVVPVDLNVLMVKLEEVIATNFTTLGDAGPASKFRAKADRRKELLRDMFFDDDNGMFVDLELPNLELSPRLSIAAAYPMAFGIATDAQAAAVARRLKSDFLAAGGWLTTLCESGQQWDAPNGWAPMQWIVYEGLQRYGFDELATRGARRWVDNVGQVFDRTGQLREKYNVVAVDKDAAGGEYPVQDGFGWTNGIQLCLLRALRERC